MTYFDRQGRPVSQDEMVRLFSPPEQRRVAADDVVVDGAEVRVSTVHLVINHNFGSGPPLIFETMVFGPPPLEDLQWRYATEQQAQAGHDRIVGLLRAGQVDKLLASE